MAFKVQSSLKLSRKGLVMEELIDDDLETLLIILEELSESDEIIVELLTVFWRMKISSEEIYVYMDLNCYNKVY